MQPTPTTSPFIRYLAAKKSVDDRALNRHVWASLQSSLNARAGNRPLRILEIGAGIGTMVERIIEWNLTDQPVQYTAIDSNVENIEEARRRLALVSNHPTFEVAFEAIDLFEFIAREQNQTAWDLVIAHAFLDLIDLPTRLTRILSLLVNRGLFYFTINFDGLTILEPPIDPIYDALVVQLYHETMDTRIVEDLPSGDSRTGRHLFHHLSKAGATVLAAGSSDWVVFPTHAGYLADEAYFLHFIVETIQSTLAAHPSLNPDQFEQWISTRQSQIDRGELIYIAHQIDFFGVGP